MGIHSIKINNIQFYFDEKFSKVDNGIPTLNPNVSDIEHDILDDVPFFKSDFKQMGLQEMDYIMSQNGPDFLFRLANPLEKIAHALHMNEMWAEAGLVYQDFVKNPPNCKCLQEHLIKKYLKKMAIMMRAEDDNEVNEKADSQSKIKKEEKAREYNPETAKLLDNFEKRKARGYDKEKPDFSGNLEERKARGYNKEKMDLSGNLEEREAQGYNKEKMDLSGNLEERKAQGYNKEKMDLSGNLEKREGKSLGHHLIYVDYTLGTMKGPEEWDACFAGSSAR